MTEETKFETWGVLEVMGHLKLAGKMTEETIAGKAMLRIDVPAVADNAEYTRYFGGDSVYSITPTTEKVAMKVANNLRSQPISHWELREEQPRNIGHYDLAACSDSDDDDYDEDDGEPF